MPPDSFAKCQTVSHNSDKSISNVAGACVPTDDSIESGMKIATREIWKQARSNQMARIKAKKVSATLKKYRFKNEMKRNEINLSLHSTSIWRVGVFPLNFCLLKSL